MVVFSASGQPLQRLQIEFGNAVNTDSGKDRNVDDAVYEEDLLGPPFGLVQVFETSGHSENAVNNATLKMGIGHHQVVILQPENSPDPAGKADFLMSGFKR